MTCRKLPPAQIKEETARLATKAKYVLSAERRGAVTFRFNLDPQPAGRALLEIYSYRFRRVIYLGPYRSALQIEVDQPMVSERAYDHLQFRLLQQDPAQMCVWTNEQTFPYWEPGAEILVRLLRAKVLDEREGVPKSFEVEVKR
jgi:hypothetical protein